MGSSLFAFMQEDPDPDPDWMIVSRAVFFLITSVPSLQVAGTREARLAGFFEAESSLSV